MKKFLGVDKEIWDLGIGYGFRMVKENREFEKAKRRSQRELCRAKALDSELKLAIFEYNSAYEVLASTGEALHNEREKSAELIENIEVFINSIACFPKEFDTDILKIKTARKSFTEACEFSKKELDEAKKSALGAGSGIAAGAAIASVAPTAALWIATTFGTASTGTAISALSGAAATNAALAWLGGGALAAGGGGMAAGSALLALAGPIGWGIAGVSILSSITLFTLKKQKLQEEKAAEIRKVKNNTAAAKKITAEIQALLDETISLQAKLKELYDRCYYMTAKAYDSFSADEQLSLGALVNNTKAMAAALDKTVD